MSTLEPTNRILEQGQALVLALEALETIEPTGPIESATVRLLLQAYRCRLRPIVAAAPSWMAEETLSASQRIAKALATVSPILANSIELSPSNHLTYTIDKSHPLPYTRASRFLYRSLGRPARA